MDDEFRDWKVGSVANSHFGILPSPCFIGLIANVPLNQSDNQIFVFDRMLWLSVSQNFDWSKRTASRRSRIWDVNFVVFNMRHQLDTTRIA